MELDKASSRLGGAIFLRNGLATFAGMFTIKKSLGQHFLKDENICKKIIDALNRHSFKNLLEIGPGTGALTKYILQLKEIRFKAVEIDDEKSEFLLRTFPALKGRLIRQNFLEMDLPFEDPFFIVGNFPYNISSQILFRILDWKHQVLGMIGMFQKEVAHRVAAKEGSKAYGVLSVLVQAFFDVRYLFEVSENCFQPQPKVKSAVIELSPRKAELNFRSEKDFIILVKTAFNQRRKMLRNAVKNLFEDAVMAEEIFTRRAEQLNIEQFAELTFRMKENIFNK